MKENVTMTLCIDIMRCMTYDFTLILSGSPELTDDLADKLFAAGAMMARLSGYTSE